MKSILCLSLCILFQISDALAQRKLNETVALQDAQQIVLHMDDASQLHIDTWQQSNIAITGTVNINENENNDAYQINTLRDGKTLTIEASVKDEDSLPKKITIRQNGQDYILNASSTTDSIVQKFIHEKGGYDWMSTGVQKDIALKVMVPANIRLSVENKFGTVEIAKVTAPLEVENKFGDIDVNIDPAAALTLTSDTKFGTVYTDLDWQLKKEGSLTLIKGDVIEGTLNGGGTPLQLNAKFGNVYLRARKH